MMFYKNRIFYQNERIYKNPSNSIDLTIEGEDNEIYLQPFQGEGVLNINLRATKHSIIKFGENNSINNSITINSYSHVGCLSLSMWWTRYWKQ